MPGGAKGVKRQNHISAQSFPGYHFHTGSRVPYIGTSIAKTTAVRADILDARQFGRNFTARIQFGRSRIAEQRDFAAVGLAGCCAVLGFVPKWAGVQHATSYEIRILAYWRAIVIDVVATIHLFNHSIRVNGQKILAHA